jgi:hypothetical protein
MKDGGIFMAILSILRPESTFYGHLEHFVVIWYIYFWYVVPIKIWQPCIFLRLSQTSLPKVGLFSNLELRPTHYFKEPA